jgi:hypothetical protein
MKKLFGLFTIVVVATSIFFVFPNNDHMIAHDIGPGPTAAPELLA